MIDLRLLLLPLVPLAVGVACADDELSQGPLGDDVTLDDDSGADATSSSGSSSSGAAPSPWIVTDESVQAAGMQHDYVLVVPRTPAKASLPIVFAYHGDVGNGRGLYDEWKVQESTQNDAIVVYPSHEGGWNVLDMSAQNPFIAGFEAIVEQVVTQHGADRDQVTAIGWSNGGFFTQILACWRGSKLRAVGAMAGSYPTDAASTGSQWPNTYPKCEGQVPVPAVIVHGDSDGVGNGELSAVYWAYVNKCAANPEGCALDEQARSPAARPPCVNFDDAPANAPVRLCIVPNFGHAIWDQSAAAMWEFSQALP